MALAEWLAARARGRSAEQLRDAVDSPKAVEGTAAAASALGFTEPLDGALAPPGERFALADGAERRRMLREAMLRYPPYGELLRALGERAPSAETEVRWLEAWWATRGYGSSESNRREGAAAFGRLADFAGLGEYVQGRRGRPTRIRWASGTVTGPQRDTTAPARRAASEAPDAAPDLFSAAPPDRPPPPRSASPVSDVARSPGRAGPVTAVNRITVPLAGEATARIEVPLRLPRSEKRRLLDLLELLITED